MVGKVVVGGDVITYWGIATSFARGNYPTVLPWQPEFLTVYHEGTFILEGAIHAITSLPISIIHFTFSFYIISALFLFIIGLAREKTRSLWCFLPAVFGLISFGGPVFLTSFSGSIPKIASQLSLQPIFSDLKQGIGSGAPSFEGYAYVNFHTLALAMFLLFLYVLFNRKKINISYRYIILIILCVVTLSVEELFFFIQIPIIGYFFLKDNYKIPKKMWRWGLGLLFFAILLFFLVQNPVRDSLLTPSPQSPRFTLLNPFNTNSVVDRYEFISSQKMSAPNTPQVKWSIWDLRFIVFISIIVSIVSLSPLSLILSISALISFCLGMTLTNTFWTANALRFFMLSYSLCLLALSFSLIEIWNRYKKIGRIVCIIFLLLMLPNILVTHAHIIHDSTPVSYDNYFGGVDNAYPTLDKLNSILKTHDRIIFIDNDYPKNSFFSDITIQAVMRYGFFVPTANPEFKVLNTDTNSEWYDAVTTLSAEAFKKLGVQYVFIFQNAETRFSGQKQKLLNNKKYFVPIFSNSQGTLFKVNKSFYSIIDTEMNLEKMIASIPPEKKVYLTQFSIQEVRKGLIVFLAKKDNIFGPVFSIGADYPMYIETTLSSFTAIPELSDAKNIDYIFADPDKFNIPTGFEEVAKTPNVVLWKRLVKH